MKKTYWIHCPRGFANEYTLAYATTDEEVEWLRAHDYERITYKDMRKKTAAERDRRKYDPSFAYYGDIAPHSVAMIKLYNW